MKAGLLATVASMFLLAAMWLIVYCYETEGTQLVAAFAGGCCGAFAIHLTVDAAAAQARERVDR